MFKKFGGEKQKYKKKMKPNMPYRSFWYTSKLNNYFYLS